MSPVYGVTKYGTPRHYGYDAMPAAINAQRAIIGGQAPWMLTATIPWRNACVTVSTVNPTTWADDTELPALGIGGQRAATFENWRYQRETLTLVLNDPSAYLPPGAYSGLIAPHTLVRPTWTVESPGGTLTFPGNVYSIESVPQRDDDVLGGSPLTLTAVDFLDPLLAQVASSSGYLALTTLAPLTADAILDGMTPIGSGNVITDPDRYTLSIATIIAAQLFLFNRPGATALVVDPAWDAMDLVYVTIATPTASEATTDGSVPVPVTIPGTPATFRDVLDFLWLYEPFSLTYGANGYVHLHPGTQRRDSGYVVSRNATVGGVLALPWETLQRATRAAAFTAVTYSAIENDPTQPTEDGGSSFETPIQTPVGHAESTSSVNPFLTTRQQTITDRTPGLWPRAHLDEYARWLLSRELGQADPVTLALDSAFPIVELGAEIRLNDPPRANGYWQIVGVQQPFSEATQALSLEWREDAD